MTITSSLWSSVSAVSQATAPASSLSSSPLSRWMDSPLVLVSGYTECDVLVHKMAQWLKEYDGLYYESHLIEDIHEAIEEILSVIMNLLGMLRTSSSMLMVIMVYADMFVKRSGIRHNQLFNLMLTSSVVTVKFWNESVVVSNKNIARLFHFALSDVNLMERRFLSGINYNLCIFEDYVKTFITSIHKEFQTSTNKSASPMIIMSTVSEKIESPFPVRASRGLAICRAESWEKGSMSGPISMPAMATTAE